MKDLGKLHYILGLSVVHDEKNGCVWLNQRHCCRGEEIKQSNGIELKEGEIEEEELEEIIKFKNSKEELMIVSFPVERTLICDLQKENLLRSSNRNLWCKSNSSLDETPLEFEKISQVHQVQGPQDYISPNFSNSSLNYLLSVQEKQDSYFFQNGLFTVSPTDGNLKDSDLTNIMVGFILSACLVKAMTSLTPTEGQPMTPDHLITGLESIVQNITSNCTSQNTHSRHQKTTKTMVFKQS
ncbi:uncharacterized protein LOC143234954 [Tachypleus tridentatus]|uniref:uncharacterized protein LOC143234954 n=1 Tax=Tachypleus tridentatus TaxID=6853 RepID=UPI003FD018F1